MNFDSRGLIGTMVFHLALLLMFVLFGFRTPLPLPAERGILINFGDSDVGTGEEEPKRSQEASQPEPQAAKETFERSSDDESFLTQETEEAPAIKTSGKTQHKKEQKKVTEQATPTTKTEVEKEEKKVEEKPAVDARAIYRGKKPDSPVTSGEGVSTGSGNQGSLTGSENATDHSLGSGGDGVSFSLAGRNVLALPKPDIDSQKEGKVVVEIRVDRSGRVINANPGVKGSTTLDSYLLGIAKKYALASKFDSKADAPTVQIGTITYIFKLK
ncbi:MAG: hypothetical protein PVF73_03095 [Bacteroidales bacterium]|jgi:outer membrane biosynthesis protein TonB